ncbi:MAG: hypothetical protein PUB51_02105 [Oscillospiraceae bacterium]|nr:hypothetical protein [Oscillospiraceae bacterium]
MKVLRCVLKLAAVAAVAAAAAYAVTKYWDRIEDMFYVLVGKVKDKKVEYFPSEYEDFAD